MATGAGLEGSRESFRAWLEGVVVAETALSLVDGARGRLLVRGFDVEALARDAAFEDAYALLLDGALPASDVRARVTAALGAARAEAFARLPRLGDALEAEHAMDALRGALAHLREAGTRRPHGSRSSAFSSQARRRAGAAPVPPDPALPHAADYLRMATGAEPDLARARALDAYLVTVAEHGMSASTFTARVVASTRSDLVSAVVAAVGALKGPLHGGAPGPVLDMLDAIGSPERAEAWLEAELAAGRRIMGFGHRVYRVRDPRAAVLEEAAARLEAGFERYLLGGRRRRASSRSYALDNVEFYTAVLLEAIGLGRELFTPTFTVGRVAGWLAHVQEQRALGRLIRPTARYVGPRPEPMSA
jgi:citrate synthase